MKVKFWFLLLLVGLFTPLLKAQTDSSDLNFFALEPVMLNYSDSILYMGGEIEEYRLEFEITELDSLGKIWIEFILLPENANASLLFYHSYTPGQLDDQELIDGNEVSISFGHYYAGAIYQASVRIEDIHGHEVRTITKLLVP